MTYRSYVAEFRSGTAEIGTAISNVDEARVIVITMFRPSYLALSTKNQLDNLYNFLYLEEDQEKTRIILKNVEGRLFEQFITSTNTAKELRVQIALELLKKLLRYDEFPNSVKINLIAEDQVLLNENGIFLRELVNFTDNHQVHDKEVISSLGHTISKLLPSLEGAEATLIQQMKNGNNSFSTIADVYGAFRDVFIYQIPAQLEKRIYIYHSGGDVIDGDTVDEFLRREEFRRIENEKKREELRRDFKIDAFEQKIANQTEFTDHINTAGFENKEISLDNRGTKRILTSMEDFEIVRAAQPKTIDLNQVGRDITNSLQDIVDEFTIYSRKTAAPSEDDSREELLFDFDAECDGEPLPEATESAERKAAPSKAMQVAENAGRSDEREDADSLVMTEDYASEDESAAPARNKNKRSKKSRKRKNKKQQQLTEALRKFADEALATADEAAEQDAQDLWEEARDPLSEEDLSETISLDLDEDRDSPFYEFKSADTTKLDDESASDLDEFYKKMESFKNKKPGIPKPVQWILVGAFVVAIFVVSFLYFQDLKQPVIPGFEVNNSTLSTIQCVNVSKGQSKIAEYRWEIFLKDARTNEPEPLTVNTKESPSFTFKTPGEYLIRLTVTDKDGKTYTPIEKTITLDFDVTE